MLALLAVGGGILLAQASSPAKARAQTLVCQMQAGPPQPINAQTSAPLMITGQGTSSSQNTAANQAIQNWSSKVFGWQFAYWSKASRKSNSCTSTKPAFQWIYTCRATAQPCG